MLNAVFEPGFFSSAPVHVALAAGGVVALVSGIVGSFAVVRGQSYAGHALADISVTGGSASFLVGVSPLWGFVGVGVLAAGVMDMIGVQRPRGRDLATGIVRGAGLGLAALFLYWDTTHSNVTGATITILFGSLFTVSSSILPAIVALSVAAVAIVAVLYRPLLLSTVAADLAAARGVSVRLVGLACLVAIALAVSLSAMTIGTILSTALLIGPAAIGAPAEQPPGPGHGLVGAGRPGRHLAGRAARLRQLLLAAGPAWLAGQLLRGDADLPGLRGRADDHQPGAAGLSRCSPDS